MEINKKGFTLVELLAVIVVLGIIMSVAGVAGVNMKKEADIKTAKKLEKTLTDLGASIYSYEMVKKGDFYDTYNSRGIITQDFYAISQIERKSTENQGKSILISLSELKAKKYLESDTLKVGNKQCYGFLRIYRTSSGPFFEGNVCCPNVYSTNLNASNEMIIYNSEECVNYFDTLGSGKGTVVSLSD